MGFYIEIDYTESKKNVQLGSLKNQEINNI